MKSRQPNGQKAYQQLADRLRRLILDGQYQPGQQLPTERELAEQSAASRITVRHALQVLADEMLVERRQGSGTYVSPAPTRRIPVLTADFSGSIARHAPEMQRQLHEWSWQPAAPFVADMLQLPADSRVLFARRVDCMGSEPVAFDEAYLTEESANRLDKLDLSQLSFLERWQEVQRIQLSHITQSIEAAAAEEHHRQFLQIEVGAPVLKETDIVSLSSGRMCGLFVSFYRSDIFRLASTFKLQLDHNSS